MDKIAKFLKWCVGHKILLVILIGLILGGLWTGRSALSWIHVFRITHSEGAELSLSQQMIISGAVERDSLVHGLDPLLVLAVIEVESHFKPQAHSSLGALGLMQIEPSTVKGTKMSQESIEEIRKQLVDDISFNISMGTTYLSYLINRYQGHVEWGLMAYNQGPTAVDRIYNKSKIPEDRYSKKVMEVYKGYSKI